MAWEETFMDKLQDEARTNPFKDLGKRMFVRPENQAIIFDITTKMGGCSNLYYSFVFWLPKIDYSIAKVDEYMEVTPTHIDTYNLTIAQKQKLEASIKTGLASAAQAVADYELLAHDMRRYREIWDYFKKGKSDDHVLRSLFIDRVDAYTGEGFSMVTMTKRWPTIITDFIRISGKKIETIDDIKRELDVSQAEATILKTKNELFNEWKILFMPTVKDRLARIENMAKSREKSVEEYKNWLKPYVARYKLMREATEQSPAEFRQDPIMTPGFSQAVAYTGVRLWVWRPFILTEKGKPTYEVYKMSKKSSNKANWVIDPYDDIVKTHVPEIAKKYNLKITDKQIEDIKNKAIKPFSSDVSYYHYEIEKPRMDPRFLYYQLFDVKIGRSIIKTPAPEGGELENIMFWPLETWVISQNIMLLYLIELWARDKYFTNYVEQLVGSKNLEDEVRKRLDEEYEKAGMPPETKKFSMFKKKQEKKEGIAKTSNNFSGLKDLFVKGPYERNFAERVTKMYLVESGGAYGELVGFIKKQIGA